jgi:hypothetical protein
MTRGVWAVLAVCAAGVGCRGPVYYDSAPVPVPPVAAHNGTRYEVVDARPERDRKPFTGAATLYHLDKVKPTPFEQVLEEAKAAVAAMPEKPTGVTVTVTSCRLVLMDENKLKSELRTGTVTVLWLDVDYWVEKPEDLYPVSPADHPDGASCSLEATVTLEFAGKPARTFPVKTIATGPNVSGTQYWGEALEMAARGAAFQFGRQFRSAVGLNPDP